MRSIQAVLALVLALCSSAAMALGLGDIRVLSKPGQPLVAEIPVISNDPGELENARVGLASAVTFERVGLARPEGLVSELQFEFAQDARGRTVIRVTSAAPVEVSALSFLIEVDWGQGRLVREYSALVNAPETATAIAEPLIEAPAAAPSNTIVRDPVPLAELPPATPAPPTSQPLPPTAPAPAAVAAPAPVARPQASFPAEGDSLPVQRGQALSHIASQLTRENGHTLDQTMVALLRANPEAFIRGNVNLLKQGAVLRAPRQDELAQLDPAQARAIVAGQTAQWRQARAPIPQPAGGDTAVARTQAVQPAPATSGARLEIAPAVAGAQQAAGTTTGLDAGGEGDMLANEQLRQAKEDLATRDAELQELRERVADLEKLQKQQQTLIAMKDTDLAAAQQRLAQAPDAAQASGTPAWLWAGVVLLVLGALAWWLSRRRKPSPLPPLARHGFDSAELAAAMPATMGAAALVDVAALDERAQDESQVREDELAGEVGFQVPAAVDADAGTWRDDDGGIGDEQAEVFVTDGTGQWRDLDPAMVAPLNPAPAGRERLELAIAYMDLGDAETARTLLSEVAVGSDPQACAEAVELLERLR